MNINFRLMSVFLLAVLLATVGMAAAGENRNFRTHLTGDEVVAPVDTRAQGQAIFQLSQDGGTLSFKLMVANIENVRAAHIHVGAAGTNGGVIAPLYSGGLIEGRFDGVLAEGEIDATEELLAALRDGNAYVQVHTTQNASGEIRGQID